MRLQHGLLKTVITATFGAALAFAQTSGTPAQPQSGTPQSGTQTKSTSPSETRPHKGSGHVAGAAGTSESMLGKTDQQFMNDAAQGGMAEVQMAQMAQQKGNMQEVKDYGRKLEQDHTQANDKLKAIAQQRQMQLPTTLDAHHQEMVSRLNGLSGEAFDRTYIRMMIQDHRKDIKEFERQASRGMDTDLKEFASSTLPTLKEHLQAAEQINNSTRSRKAEKPMSGSQSDSQTKPSSQK